MWEWKYAKEPLDMKLLLLRLVDKIGIVIIAALLGAAIIGGGYTISKVFFGGPTEYEMSQRYYVQYAIDPQVDVEYTYINHASWDMWVKSDWFTEKVWDYTFQSGINPAQYGYEKEDLADLLSGGLETDLRVVIGKVKTTNPTLTERLSEMLTKVFMEFAEQQIEIEEMRVVDTLEVKEADKDIRILRAVILGAVIGLFVGLLGVLVYLVADDAIYLPKTLIYRYGEPVLGCVFEGPAGPTLQLGTKENVEAVLKGCKSVALTAVDAELALPTYKALFPKEDLVCVPSVCQVPEAISVLAAQDGVILVVQAGACNDSQITYVLEQMKLHGCKQKGMLFVGADPKLMKRYGLPVKGE
ncbi:MAG: hypothetical protein IJY10_04125 [Lachnospiraceae bacterium]|nr:hypothetical protein [Lachnospiraceae bacterium]